MSIKSFLSIFIIKFQFVSFNLCMFPLSEIDTYLLIISDILYDEQNARKLNWTGIRNNNLFQL